MILPQDTSVLRVEEISIPDPGPNHPAGGSCTRGYGVRYRFRTMESEGDTPRTGRARIKRGELTRERVLAAALALVEREGAGALSMRRVANELKTAPMSLYRHVADKADLVDGVVALALVDLSTSPPEGAEWSDRALAWMSGLRDQLSGHPKVMALLRTKHLLLPAMLAPVEVLLEDLERAGFDRPTAARAAWEMLWFTMGFVLSEQRAFSSERSPAAFVFDTAAARAEELPRIAEALPEFHALDGNDIFASGARHLVTGLRQDLERPR